jgi:hypothetical protein
MDTTQYLESIVHFNSYTRYILLHMRRPCTVNCSRFRTLLSGGCQPKLPPRLQKSVTRVAIKMHGPFSESEASIESLCIIGSLWTHFPSRKDYAF